MYLLTEDGRMILLDFENSCRAHYINDIAVALYYARLHKFSNADKAFNDAHLAAFLKGYETEYAVPADELVHIPWRGPKEITSSYVAHHSRSPPRCLSPSTSIRVPQASE